MHEPLTSEINEIEIEKIIKNSSANNSPGADGLTNEFYKHFWSNIHKYLMASYKASLNMGNLSISQWQGAIPKANKDSTRLKNWQPIALLNQDYKYLAKWQADKCKTTLPNIINEDQSGFVPGRVIGSNL